MQKAACTGSSSWGVPGTRAPPGKVALHGGLRDVYYMYKMLLSTFRSRLGPGRAPARETAVPPRSHEEVPS